MIQKSLLLLRSLYSLDIQSLGYGYKDGDIKLFILIKMQILKKTLSVPFRYVDEIQIQQGKIFQGILVLVSK